MKRVIGSRVVSLTLVESPIKEPMVRRGFQLAPITKSRVDTLSGLMQDVGLSNVSSLSAATTLSDLVTLSDSPEGEVDLPNGSLASRFSYTLVMDAKYDNGMMEKIEATGYTDVVADVSDRLLPNELTLYINSCQVLATRRLRNTVNRQVLSNDHVIVSPHNLTEDSYKEPDSLFLQRPSDAYKDLSVARYAESVGRGKDEFTDTISSLGRTDASVSARRHSGSSSFISTILNSASLGKSSGEGTTVNGLSNAYGYTKDVPMTGNLLVRILKGDERNRRFEKGYYTIGDLMDADETFNRRRRDDRVSVHFEKSIHRFDSDSLGGKSNFLGRTAQEFVFAVTALMTRHKIDTITFSTTTEGADCDNPPPLKVSDWDPGIGGKKLANLHELVAGIRTEALPSVSRNLRIPLRIKADVDVGGMSDIRIACSEVDRGEWKPFVFLTSVDSLYSPIVTTNPSSALSDGVDTMLSELDVLDDDGWNYDEDEELLSDYTY